MRGLRRAAVAAFVVVGALAGTAPALATQGTADMAATMSGPATASVGQTVTYGVQLTNGGPDTASGIVFTATITGPGQYTTNIVAPQARCSIHGSTISCKGGEIPPGITGVFDVGVTMTGVGTVVQNFTVTADQADPNPANNSGTITTTVT